jgi:hypothetical protein
MIKAISVSIVLIYRYILKVNKVETKVSSPIILLIAFKAIYKINYLKVFKSSF